MIRRRLIKKNFKSGLKKMKDKNSSNSFSISSKNSHHHQQSALSIDHDLLISSHLTSIHSSFKMILFMYIVFLIGASLVSCRQVSNENSKYQGKHIILNNSIKMISSNLKSEFNHQSFFCSK